MKTLGPLVGVCLSFFISIQGHSFIGEAKEDEGVDQLLKEYEFELKRKGWGNASLLAKEIFEYGINSNSRNIPRISLNPKNKYQLENYSSKLMNKVKIDLKQNPNLNKAFHQLMKPKLKLLSKSIPNFLERLNGEERNDILRSIPLYRSLGESGHEIVMLIAENEFTNGNVSLSHKILSDFKKEFPKYKFKNKEDEIKYHQIMALSSMEYSIEDYIVSRKKLLSLGISKDFFSKLDKMALKYFHKKSSKRSSDSRQINQEISSSCGINDKFFEYDIIGFSKKKSNEKSTGHQKICIKNFAESGKTKCIEYPSFSNKKITFPERGVLNGEILTIIGRDKEGNEFIFKFNLGLGILIGKPTFVQLNKNSVSTTLLTKKIDGDLKIYYTDFKNVVAINYDGSLGAGEVLQHPDPPGRGVFLRLYQKNPRELFLNSIHRIDFNVSKNIWPGGYKMIAEAIRADKFLGLKELVKFVIPQEEDKEPNRPYSSLVTVEVIERIEKKLEGKKLEDLTTEEKEELAKFFLKTADVFGKPDHLSNDTLFVNRDFWRIRNYREKLKRMIQKYYAGVAPIYKKWVSSNEKKFTYQMASIFKIGPSRTK